MPTEIVVQSIDPYLNSHKIITTPSLNIILFNRNIFDTLKNEPLFKNNGIYLIYNLEKTYIGQNSSEKGVLSRLKHHYQSKDWWKKGIFFSYRLDTLTKSDYDYIEKTLINRFLTKQIPLDNKTNGNTSPIKTVDQNRCEQIMAEFIFTLNQVLNIDIFQLNSQNRIQQLEQLVNQLLDGTLEEENSHQ